MIWRRKEVNASSGSGSNAGAVVGGLLIVTAAALLLTRPAAAQGTASLSGVVSDADSGMVLPGVTVTLGSNSITTDENGYYEFDNMATGNYQIMFSVLNYATEGPMAITLHSGVNSLNEAMTPVVTVQYAEFKGTVTDSSTGAALSGVTVTVGSYSFTTASDGTFDITGIPVGSYAISFAKSGYVTINL